MERLTYVCEDGSILFHPEELPDNEGVSIVALALGGRFKALDQIAARLAELESRDTPKRLLNYNKISAAGNCPCCMVFVDSYAAYCHNCGQRLEDEE